MQCTQLLVAAALVIGSVGGSWAGDDEPLEFAETTCNQNYRADHPTVPTGSVQAKNLRWACREGVQLGRISSRQPRFGSHSDFTIFSRLRADNRETRATCSRSFDDQSRLQERLACFDGADYYSGFTIKEREDVTRGEKPSVRFDHDYYLDHSYETVYSDLTDRDWAYVLVDRLTNPRNYPADRLDALYVPRLSDEIRPAAHAYAREHAGDRDYPYSDPNSSSWFWWWHLQAYRNCYACAYRPETFFNTAAYEARDRRPSTTVGAGPTPIVRGGLGAFGGRVNSAQNGIAAHPSTFPSYSGRATATMPAIQPATPARVIQNSTSSPVTVPSPARAPVSAPVVTARPSPVFTAPARVSISPSISISAGG